MSPDLGGSDSYSSTVLEPGVIQRLGQGSHCYDLEIQYTLVYDMMKQKELEGKFIILSHCLFLFLPPYFPPLFTTIRNGFHLDRRGFIFLSAIFD